MAASDTPVPASRPNRADGRAMFTVALLVVGVLTIAALDRVGAPDGFVRALGPALALAAGAIVGLGARNADLPSYLAAGRRVSPLYGAFALTALAAGMALCLYPNSGAAGDPPWQAVAVGTALGALGLGPMLRRFGASWRSDLIATRFPFWPVRLLAGLAMLAAATLTAFAGYRGAVGVVEALVAPDPAQARAIVAIGLVLSVVPGGMASLVASAGAGAGALVVMTAAELLLKGGAGAAAFGAHALVAPSTGDVAAMAGAALAAAGFFVLDPPALASSSARSAVRGARGGVLLCLALAAALALGLPALSAGTEVSETLAASLTGGAALAAMLAMAAAGVHCAARAFGIALASPPRPFPALASVRLARMRAVQLLVTLGCVFGDAGALAEPRTALVAAMALSLALTTPLLALAAIPRAGPVAAAAALAAALAVLGARWETLVHPADAGALFATALAATGAAFVVGVLVSLVAARRGPAPTPGRFDPFADRSR